MTLGGDGSVVLDSTSATPIQRIAPVRVNAVDTTGCGDSFMGTVLAGLASGMALSEAAELASYVSAYAATGYGAQAPTAMPRKFAKHSPNNPIVR